MALGFQDPRVRVEITDGIKWVEEAAEGTYDAIIVDSSDPVGPAEVLFQKVRPVHRKRRLWVRFLQRQCVHRVYETWVPAEEAWAFVRAALYAHTDP